MQDHSNLKTCRLPLTLFCTCHPSYRLFSNPTVAAFPTHHAQNLKVDRRDWSFDIIMIRPSLPKRMLHVTQARMTDQQIELLTEEGAGCLEGCPILGVMLTEPGTGKTPKELIAEWLCNVQQPGH